MARKKEVLVVEIPMTDPPFVVGDVVTLSPRLLGTYPLWAKKFAERTPVVTSCAPSFDFKTKKFNGIWDVTIGFRSATSKPSPTNPHFIVSTRDISK